MFWRYVEKKVKNNFYPDLLLLSQNIPRCVRASVYKKYGLNVRFEIVPEFFSSMLYYWHFFKYKDYHYPTDDDIKWFYFSLFKKNGFLFILFCCIVYRNCFIDFISLLIKSGTIFYLLIYFIYILFFLRKYIYIYVKMIKQNPLRFSLILIIIFINKILNKIFNFNIKKTKWYF